MALYGFEIKTLTIKKQRNNLHLSAQRTRNPVCEHKEQESKVHQTCKINYLWVCKFQKSAMLIQWLHIAASFLASCLTIMRMSLGSMIVFLELKLTIVHT